MVTNYAKNIKTKEFIFFSEFLLVQKPSDWVVWFPVDTQPEIRVIGENTVDYCARLDHKAKVCAYCKKGMSPLLANRLAEQEANKHLKAYS